MNRTKISGIGSLVAIFVASLWLLPSVGQAQGMSGGPPIPPNAHVPLERVVILGNVDLDSTGDVVLETFDTRGRKRLDHHVEILVPGLTTDDLPAVSLYDRRRTTAPPISPPFDAFNSGFVLHPGRLQGSDVTTLLRIEDGKILLRYRRDRFDPPSAATPTDVFYGLDGVGGTGDFRLVLIW